MRARSASFCDKIDKININSALNVVLDKNHSESWLATARSDVVNIYFTNTEIPKSLLSVTFQESHTFINDNETKISHINENKEGRSYTFTDVNNNSFEYRKIANPSQYTNYTRTTIKLPNMIKYSAKYWKASFYIEGVYYFTYIDGFSEASHELFVCENERDIIDCFSYTKMQYYYAASSLRNRWPVIKQMQLNRPNDFLLLLHLTDKNKPIIDKLWQFKDDIIKTNIVGLSNNIKHMVGRALEYMYKSDKYAVCSTYKFTRLAAHVPDKNPETVNRMLKLTENLNGTDACLNQEYERIRQHYMKIFKINRMKVDFDSGFNILSRFYNYDNDIDKINCLIDSTTQFNINVTKLRELYFIGEVKLSALNLPKGDDVKYFIRIAPSILCIKNDISLHSEATPFGLMDMHGMHGRRGMHGMYGMHGYTASTVNDENLNEILHYKNWEYANYHTEMCMGLSNIKSEHLIKTLFDNKTFKCPVDIMCDFLLIGKINSVTTISRWMDRISQNVTNVQSFMKFWLSNNLASPVHQQWMIIFIKLQLELKFYVPLHELIIDIVKIADGEKMDYKSEFFVYLSNILKMPDNNRQHENNKKLAKLIVNSDYINDYLLKILIETYDILHIYKYLDNILEIIVWVSKHEDMVNVLDCYKINEIKNDLTNITSGILFNLKIGGINRQYIDCVDACMLYFNDLANYIAIDINDIRERVNYGYSLFNSIDELDNLLDHFVPENKTNVVKTMLKNRDTMCIRDVQALLGT
jgi:hypothetical protein